MKLEYSNRQSILWGYVILIILAYFGAHYALIRFTAYDAAYYLYKIIDREGFFIAHGRTISYFAQWPAVVAVKLGLSMKLLLPIASLGYSLFFIVHYFLATKFKTKENLFWLVVFLPLIALRYKYYSPISESILSLASISLFYVVMANATRAYSIMKWVFLFLISITIYMGHPLAYMGVFIMIIFHALWQRDYLNKTRIYAFVINAIFLVAKIRSVQASGYESEKFDDATSNFSKLSAASDHWVYLQLDNWILDEAIWPLFAFCAALFILLYHRRIIPLVFLLFSYIAIKHIITFVYWDGESPNMLHSYYAYLSIPWSLGIIYAGSLIPKKGFVLAFFFFLSIQSIWEIREQRKFFMHRLSYFDSVFEKFPDSRKQIIPIDQVDMKKVHVVWAVPFETMIYTAYEDPRDTKTLFINNWNDGDVHFQKSQENPSMVLGEPWSTYKIDDGAKLDSNYFILPPKSYVMH
jgi:hypothetical protein